MILLNPQHFSDDTLSNLSCLVAVRDLLLPLSGYNYRFIGFSCHMLLRRLKNGKYDVGKLYTKVSDYTYTRNFSLINYIISLRIVTEQFWARFQGKQLGRSPLESTDFIGTFASLKSRKLSLYFYLLHGIKQQKKCHTLNMLLLTGTSTS
jgi:hypothetical protein